MNMSIFSIANFEILFLTCCSSDLDLPSETHSFQMFLFSKKKKVPANIDKEGVLSWLV